MLTPSTRSAWVIVRVRCRTCHGRMGKWQAENHSCAEYERLLRLRQEDASPREREGRITTLSTRL